MRASAAWLVLLVAVPLGAQDAAAPRRAVATRGELVALGAAAVGSALLTGIDRSIADRMRDDALHRGDLLPGAAAVARVFGDPGVFVFSAGLWGIGRITDRPTVERIGGRAVEAIVASGAVTAFVKVASGRARPETNPADARDFVFARGLRDGAAYQSLPSGHTTAAFAFAAAVDAEWQRLSPRRPPWVAPVLYSLATLTGLSRMYDDRHWASDVLLGGAVGAVTAHAVVRFRADRP